jgi:hypothetical protein
LTALCVQQSLPDATIVGAGSWDALYFPDELTQGAPNLHKALAKRSTSPLCKRVSTDSNAAGAASQHPVFWVNQPRPVNNRLKTPEKRQYVTDEAIQQSNAAHSANQDNTFAAIVDLYEVGRCGATWYMALCSPWFPCLLSTAVPGVKNQRLRRTRWLPLRRLAVQRCLPDVR